MPARATFEEVVERLAPMTRRAGSEDEAKAAEWLAQRLWAAGAAVRVEEERFHDGYASLLCGLAASVAVAGATAACGRASLRAAAVAAAAGGLLADDVSNGPRLGRRLFAPRRTTQNVVAEVGSGDRTLVVIAHHDAAPTGAIFDQALHRAVAARFPDFIERTDTAFPLWWPAMAGPVLVTAGGLLRRRRLAAAGAALGVLGTALFADIARNRIVPGANDNLSGCAVLVALAERLQANPVPGLRVLLVSCGAEEVMQGGIRAFHARHGDSLPRDRTWFLNLDTIGSPFLLLLEGEGCFVMEDYTDPSFRDLIAATAAESGIPLKRGMRARASTDSVIPSRAGFATATLCSIDDVKTIPNYHLMTDTPENLDYATVEHALDLTEALARALPRAGP
jgi:hypothetical protein